MYVYFKRLLYFDGKDKPFLWYLDIWDDFACFAYPSQHPHPSCLCLGQSFSLQIRRGASGLFESIQHHPGPVGCAL